MKNIFILPVIKGQGRGKKIGIPTINLKPENIDIPYGIYAGFIFVGNKKYKAAIHFGPRPVYKEKDPSFEVYIIEKELPKLAQNQYKVITVAYIRKVMNFPSEKDMVEQIEKDVGQIIEVLL